MDAAEYRPEFAPPPEPALARAFVLAVIAHLLLVAALTWGVNWKRETQDVAAEAELWSSVPQQAAPPPPPPPPAPAPPPPAPPPPVTPPVVRAPPLPDPQVQREAQIALEQERKHREELKRELAEKKRAAEAKRELAERRRAEEARRELAEQRKADQERERRKELAERRREEELAKKKEQAKQLAEAKRKEDERKRKLEEHQEKKLAQMREDNLRRIQGMAGSGAPASTGAAAQASGPSADWGARVQARVRPNIVFTDTHSGNPKAVVRVRTSPDGTIVSKRLVEPSGNKEWDDAVLRALDKTETLPRDPATGRVPSEVDIGFRPRG